MSNCRVVDYMPLNMIVQRVPDGFTVCYDKAVQNASGTVGALVRNASGVYFIAGALGSIASIDQRFAKSIAQGMTE